MPPQCASLQEELEKAGAVAQILVRDYLANHDRQLVNKAANEQWPNASPVDKMWLEILLALHALDGDDEQEIVAGHLYTARGTAKLMDYEGVVLVTTQLEHRNAMSASERQDQSFNDFVASLTASLNCEVSTPQVAP